MNTYYTQNFSWKTLEFCPLTSGFLQVHRIAVTSETYHWDFETFIFHPDVLIACRPHHWLLTLMIEERHYFSGWRSNLDFFFFGLLSFWSYFILFCTIFWQENETKGKGSLYTFYFKLQFIWASNTSVLFNSSGWYLSGFLKYNIH